MGNQCILGRKVLYEARGLWKSLRLVGVLSRENMDFERSQHPREKSLKRGCIMEFVRCADPGEHDDSSAFRSRRFFNLQFYWPLFVAPDATRGTGLP